MDNRQSGSAERSRFQLVILLLGFYAASVVCHLALLRGAATFPHISSDEVQYKITAENVRLGRGFVLRGAFNSTSPPAYVVFASVARSIGRDPDAAMFIVSTCVMCAALFPVFGFARLLGLDATIAAILGLAAAFLPHTFYSAMYMTEVLQYPSYLLVFYVAIRWIDNRSWKLDVLLGVGIGFLLLVKVQGIQFLGGFLIAIIAVAFRQWRSRKGSPLQVIAYGFLVVMIALAIQGSWYFYKTVQGGSVLGLYGSTLADQGLPFWSVKLTAAYFADFLLAPGLITAVLVYYWLRYNGNDGRSALVGSVLLVQLIAVSTLDGGLTGWLRERLFIYAIPISAVVATRGLVLLRDKQSATATRLVVLVPLGLIGLLALYPFHVASVIEVPWANALGSADIVSFSKWLLTASASVTILVSGMLILWSAPSDAPLRLAVFLLVFNVASFIASSRALAGWAEVGLRTAAPVVQWLTSSGVRGGNRLLVAGRHGFFESSSLRAAPVDGDFLDWTWRNGLSEPLEWQIEALGLLDVRMIPSAPALKAEARPGDYFLTTSLFSELPLVSTHDPFRLYRIDAPMPFAPNPRSVSEIPAEQFYTLIGSRERSGRIVGSSSGIEGYLVYGPYLGTAPGKYCVRFGIGESHREQLSVDIADKTGKVYAVQHVEPGKIPTITFSLASAADLQFRVVGKSVPDFSFDGVTLERVPPRMKTVAPPVPVVATTAFSNVLPKELLGKRRAPGGACYVDLLNGAAPAAVIEASRKSAIQVVGWALEPEGHRPPVSVYFELAAPDGATFWAKATPSSRPDVAAAFKEPAAEKGGFTVSADAQELPTGSYRIKVILNGTQTHECDLNRVLELQ